ncbi:MAG: DNA replication/repair protein RecF [Clostridia bacterium]|nr:DNA replication/repair protein RecF [Clostridia bacterium]
MYVKKVFLQNFRNYTTQSVELGSALNVFSGRNAVGKTNFLEAIYTLGIGKSPRTVKEREMVRFGANGAWAKAEVCKKYGNHTIEIYIDKKDKKRVAIDKLPLKKLGELMGTLGVVYFSPDELGLVKDAPSERRRFLDIALSQQSKTYFYTLGKYNKSLISRNKLLKEGGQSLQKTLDVWDEQVAGLGASLVIARQKFVDKLSVIASKVHEKVSLGEKLCLSYESSIVGESADLMKEDMLNKLEESRERDILLGFTSVGPHRDDIGITVNGLDVKKYGSQGQQRTVALSLKLSELELFKEEMGEYPVLLLDDVLSELDKARREKLLDEASKVQTILTCTHFEQTLPDSARHFTVKEGETDNKIERIK